MKYSKKSKGAEVLEATEQAPIETVTEIPKEEIHLEPEEVGIPIYIFAPKHCKSFRKLAEKQFRAGIVSRKGAVKLPDGQEISAGATIKTKMLPGLKRMLIDGVFLAGKAPRKEKGTRKAV